MDVISDLKPAIGADDEQSIELAKKVHPEGWSQTEANAHLIAAAPNMYKALKLLIERLENFPNFPMALQLPKLKAEEAIAKAEANQ